MLILMYILFKFSGDNIDYMFDTIFQLYYIFYGSNNMSLGSILLPVFK